MKAGNDRMTVLGGPRGTHKSNKFIIETMTMDIGQAQEQGVAGPPPLDAPRFLRIDPPGASIHHVELYCPENLRVDKDNTFIWVANDLGKVGDYSYILFGAYLFLVERDTPLLLRIFGSGCFLL